MLTLDTNKLLWSNGFFTSGSEAQWTHINDWKEVWLRKVPLNLTFLLPSPYGFILLRMKTNNDLFLWAWWLWNKSWDSGKKAHLLSFLMGKLELQKVFPAANLLAGEGILRGGNSIEQTTNVCAILWTNPPVETDWNLMDNHSAKLLFFSAAPGPIPWGVGYIKLGWKGKFRTNSTLSTHTFWAQKSKFESEGCQLSSGTD